MCRGLGYHYLLGGTAFGYTGCAITTTVMCGPEKGFLNNRKSPLTIVHVPKHTYHIDFVVSQSLSNYLVVSVC